MSQVIATLPGANGACDLADAAAKPVYGSLCGFAQMRFDFTEAILDRVEIGRVLRQIPQRYTGRFIYAVPIPTSEAGKWPGEMP
jgi:hypothetical protein